MEEQQIKNMMREKLARWLIFSVVFALLPFWGNLLIEISKAHEITLGTVFGNKGEVLLVGIALCGVGLGEIFGSAAVLPVSTPPLLTYFFSGLSLIIICLGSLYYASVSGNTEFDSNRVILISFWGFVLSVTEFDSNWGFVRSITEFDSNRVILISFWGFVLSVVASTGCIFIAASAEGKHLQQLTTTETVDKTDQTNV
jgi:hypothetical protein